MKLNLYSKIPKVDEILENEKISDLICSGSREVVVETIREELDKLRKKINKDICDVQSLEEEVKKIVDDIAFSVIEKEKNNLRKVINATGVVIHTNLGRSLLSESAVEHINEISTNYSNLEFNLENNGRGIRYSHVEEIIKKITGAEAAIVVNNNAAAVILTLKAMCENQEVIVSRGELVEIGGSFRIPEVMEQSGVTLVDVGATNRTHLFDYEKAITDETRALLKVHTSNYKILGFTSSVELEELVGLGNKRDIPVIEDLGSGVLIDLSKYGLGYEPTVQESVKKGVDVITFSGDKLLGGPQAGIIIGKSRYIDLMKTHPLNRALRIDKSTLAALESTLRLYLDEDTVRNIPTINLLTMPLSEIEDRAQRLLEKIEKISDKDSIEFKVIDDYSKVGGGSMPLEQIPTKCITISSQERSITKLEQRLRSYDTPVITRLYKDKIFIDLRTVRDREVEVVLEAIESSIKNL